MKQRFVIGSIGALVAAISLGSRSLLPSSEAAEA